MIFDIYDWYWIVEHSNTHVWSSRHNAYILVTDSAYQQWIAAGGEPTRIASVSELREVITKQAPDLAGIMTPDEFFTEFTFDQWRAIKTASITDPQIEYLLDKLRVVQIVDPASPTTIQGINYLVSQQLINQSDADRILNRGLNFD